MADKKYRSVKDWEMFKNIKGIMQGIKIPGYVDLSVYSLSKIYISGLVKGALASRAGSVSFSFFMALFPFLLFMLNLIPFIPIANLNETFFLFIESLMPDSSRVFFMSIYYDIQDNQKNDVKQNNKFKLNKSRPKNNKNRPKGKYVPPSLR